MGNFSTEIAEASGVLRELRQKKNMFIWSEPHDKAFEAVKTCLTRLSTLALFDTGLETRIETDGSKLKGLGFSLQQLHCSFKVARVFAHICRDVGNFSVTALASNSLKALVNPVFASPFAQFEVFASLTQPLPQSVG